MRPSLLKYIFCVLTISPAFADPLRSFSDAGAAEHQSLSTSQVRGVLEPSAQALLSSEIAARVLALPVEEGQRFRAKDILVKLDCSFYEAQLAAAEAEAFAAQAQLQNDRQLAQLNSIGVLEVQLSEAKLRRAEADVRVNRVLTERCVVRAPYAGRLVERHIHPHESVAQGTQLLSVVAEGAPEVRLIVPSIWLGWLKEGTTFEFRLDETGQTVSGKVKAVGARVDPVSQTVPVRAVLGQQGKPLTPGMSGTATFTLPAPPSPGGPS